ncbi:MAG: methionyl-tRNA formyltransferase [Gemmatimonadetes bacterium 13_1_40CM_66_11]|nr:MAG: methionyl-tRNA formyltransferase [Gemmatimonadetes bacterium 13_1_40CM_66_11]
MRVVFFGTPEFAVPSLRALVGEGFDVVAVVTQPDAPQGRSRSKLIPPPVKVAAEAEDLTIFQPEKPTDGAFLLRLRDLKPDIGVVVAYGHILKPELLQLPRRGMVNVHPSLLPGLRGAAPIEWAIIRGHETTGVTIIQLDAGMDSGPVLHQIPHRIPPDVTAGDLSAHLAEMGAQALVETLTMLEQSDPPPQPVPQHEERATYAPKLTREIARVDWTNDARAIGCLIRGLDPRPGAWTELNGVEIKLFNPKVNEPTPPTPGTHAPGEVLSADGSLVIATGPFKDTAGGTVEIFEVQPAGKARMTTDDWLHGARIKAGARFA